MDTPKWSFWKGDSFIAIFGMLEILGPCGREWYGLFDPVCFPKQVKHFFLLRKYSCLSSALCVQTPGRLSLSTQIRCLVVQEEAVVEASRHRHTHPVWPQLYSNAEYEKNWEHVRITGRSYDMNVRYLGFLTDKAPSYGVGHHFHQQLQLILEIQMTLANPVLHQSSGRHAWDD